jgi:hypothetical protein
VLTAKVADLLLALPKYEPMKVNKLLSRCRIAPAKTIGGLSPRQRDELAALLADEESLLSCKVFPREAARLAHRPS